MAAGQERLTALQQRIFLLRPAGARGRPPLLLKKISTTLSHVRAIAAAQGIPMASLDATLKGLIKLRLRRREFSTQASAVTCREWRAMRRLARKEQLPNVELGLALLWTAALRCQDLESLDVSKGDMWVSRGQLRIAWFQAKEAKLRGLPEVLAYSLPPRYLVSLRIFLAARGRFTRADITQIMSLANRIRPALTKHSFKRGALQHLSSRGSGWEELRVLARHKTVETTQRYVFGVVTPDMRSSVLSSHTLWKKKRRHT